jgi:hypothetical protein
VSLTSSNGGFVVCVDIAPMPCHHQKEAPLFYIIGESKKFSAGVAFISGHAWRSPDILQPQLDKKRRNRMKRKIERCEKFQADLNKRKKA